MVHFAVAMMLTKRSQKGLPVIGSDVRTRPLSGKHAARAGVVLQIKSM
jgi:hypothetical protein